MESRFAWLRGIRCVKASAISDRIPGDLIGGNMSQGENERTASINISEGVKDELLRRSCSNLARAERGWTIGSLEAALLRKYPAEDAESWDRTGLVVGERALPLTKAALALDPTPRAIEEAARAGANVLITHHPPFISAPDSFAPETSPAISPGAGVWAAIRHGVALMCFHTALDVSSQAAKVLPGMLGLDFSGQVVSPSCDGGLRGYGQLSHVRLDQAPMTLASLAARCLSVFGRAPRVWGDADKEIRTVVTATGSAGPCGRDALSYGADCLVCGEVKYHDALDLSHAGLCVIELGHDVSELPLVAVLAQSVLGFGVSEDAIVLVDQSSNWWLPDAIRI